MVIRKGPDRYLYSSEPESTEETQVASVEEGRQSIVQGATAELNPALTQTVYGYGTVESLQFQQETQGDSAIINPELQEAFEKATEQQVDVFIPFTPELVDNVLNDYFAENAQYTTYFGGTPSTQFEGKKSSYYILPIASKDSEEELSDPFRAAIDLYWQVNDSSIDYKEREQTEIPLYFNIQEEEDNTAIINITANQSFPGFMDFQETNNRRRQELPSFSENLFKEYWDNLIAELDEKEMRDILFSSYRPLKKSEIDSENFVVNPFVLEATPTYNFYSPDFEDGVGAYTQEKLELDLPNVYKIFLEKGEESDGVDTILSNVFFSSFVIKATDEVAQGILKKEFGNIVFATNNTDFMKEVYEFKNQFPMFIDHSLTTTKDLTFTSLLRQFNVADAVLKALIARDNSDAIPPASGIFGIISLLRNSDFFYTAKSEIDSSLSKVVPTTLKTFNFDNWYDYYKDNQEETFRELDEISFYPRPPLELNEPDPFEFLSSLIFKEKYSEALREFGRTFSQILNGRESYSETFGYKVTKYKANENGQKTGEPIQSFYFINSNEIETLKWVDTQVKYGEEYYYEYEAMQIVFGAKYKYDNFKYFGNSKAQMRVTVLPNVEIINVPLEKCVTGVFDSPPIAPDVNFVSYIGEKNKVSILLNSGIGEYYDFPVVIQPSDRMKYVKLYRSRDIPFTDKIRFASDDPTPFFQIFRMETKPTKYRDFVGKLLKILDTSRSTVLDDYINTNTKYYYVIRSVDIHGNLSNPTNLFQIEMVENSGANYLIVENIPFEEEKPKVFSKPIKKHIRISPSYSQALFNYEKTYFPEGNTAKGVKPLLGVVDKTIFGKTIKFRIKSKHTNKIVDINVGFVRTHRDIKE